MLYDFKPNVAVSDPDLILFFVWVTFPSLHSDYIWNLSKRSKIRMKFLPNITLSYFAFCICHSYVVPVALGSSLKIIHYIMIISIFIVIPAVMIIYHNGLRTFFFQNHQKLQQCVTSISNLLSHHGLNIFPLPLRKTYPQILLRTKTPILLKTWKLWLSPGCQ